MILDNHLCVIKTDTFADVRIPKPSLERWADGGRPAVGRHHQRVRCPGLHLRGHGGDRGWTGEQVPLERPGDTDGGVRRSDSHVAVEDRIHNPELGPSPLPDL